MYSKKLSKKAQEAINESIKVAGELGVDYVGSEHILVGLLSDKEMPSCQVLESLNVTKDKVLQILSENTNGHLPRLLSIDDMTPRSKRILQNSAYISANVSDNYIGTEHILVALVSESDSFAMQILRSLDVSGNEIFNRLTKLVNHIDNGNDANGSFYENGMSEESQGENSGNMLEQYGRNLCKMAKEGKIDPIIGREAETERVIQILSRRTKNNPCLIGEPGVGKTAVVEGLAQKIVDGNVPDDLKDKTIITLDISAMIAGAKYRGEFEERMKGVMQEVAKNKSIILFIDEIHTIIGAGAAEGAVDAANIIKPALARGEMQVIGATTIDEYRKYIEKDAALERRFQSVMVGEPTPEDAEQILFGLRDKYEAHHKVKISDEAIKAAVKLSVRYIGDRFLPDKAIDLIDEAASKIRIEHFTATPDIKELENKLSQISKDKEEAINLEDFEKAATLRDEEKTLKEELEAKKNKSNDEKASSALVVSEEDIAEIVTSWTGIPVKKLASEEGEKLLKLEEILKERIVGQDAAVESVARAIRRGRVGLKNPKRPVGSFLFLGPTGVGKTELSKTIADVMFGSENAMIRIDMSEYMDKESTSKMIGSPPGYVGYEEGGQLTESIRRHPYSVVLFDEIEKAHPDVFNIMLQILDDGVLTDSQGRKVDFKNTIIIMTSNVGAGGIVEGKKKLGFLDSNSDASEEKDIRESIMAALKDTFKPEFLNRIDETIVFNKLSSENIESIAKILLKDITNRINNLGISIEFDDEVVTKLAKDGFDPVYGARPLKRAIVRAIEDSFSEELLKGTYKAGDKIRCVIKDGNYAYEKL